MRDGYWTVTLPDMMTPWIVQWYAYVPAWVNVRTNVPDPWVGEAVPSSKVTLCCTEPFHVHVTAEPTGTVVAAGVKALSTTEMLVLVLPPAGGVLVVVGPVAPPP